MSKKCVRASPVLLLRGPVTSPPPHTLTHTHGRARQTRSRRYYRELHIYCAIPVVSARRIVPLPPEKKPSTTKQSTPQQTSRCVASVACSCRRYTLRAGLSLSLPSILYLFYSFDSIIQNVKFLSMIQI
jgi:hypothetical protein